MASSTAATRTTLSSALRNNSWSTSPSRSASRTSCCRSLSTAASRRCSAPAGTGTLSGYAVSRTTVSWRGQLSYRGTRFAAVSSTYPIRCNGGENRRPVEIAPLCVRRNGAAYTAVFSYANLSREDVIIPGRLGEPRRPCARRPGPADGLPVRASCHSHSRYRTCRSVVTSPGRSPAPARSTPHARRPIWDATAVFLVSIDGNANLNVAKVARPVSVEVGDRIEYTVTVHDAGTTPVFAPVVLDRPLDERAQLLSAASAAGHCRVLGQGTSGQRVRSACSATSPRTGRSRSSSRHGRADRDGPSTARPS